ncbi:MAG: B-box zinc finger protein [Dehalococcoidia bacterium]
MEDENTKIRPEFACCNHPDRKGTSVCWRCQKPICDECSETLLGRAYCRSCAEEMEKLNAEQEEPGILKREINSPLLMIVIIIITLVIAGVEIYVMTR